MLIDVGMHVVFSEDGGRNPWGWWAIKWTQDAVCAHPLDTEIYGYCRVWVAPSDVVRR